MFQTPRKRRDLTANIVEMPEIAEVVLTITMNHEHTGQLVTRHL